MASNHDIYTDTVLELLTAYVLSEVSDSEDMMSNVMKNIRDNHEFECKGLLEGLVFSSILHLTMMIAFISLNTGKSNAEVLQRYALIYQMTRDDVMKIPQVHPEFISKIVDRRNDSF